MRSRDTELAITPVDDGLVVSGEVDAHTAPRLERALLARITEFGSTWLDAADITFIDSSGLRVLVAATNESRSRGGDVVLVKPNDRVLNRIELGGLASFVRVA